MTEGCFVERSRDHHVALRHELLAAGTVLPPPPGPVPTGPLDRLGAQVRDAVRRDGVAVLQLDGEPRDDEYLAFGAALGAAMPEGDPAVLPFTRHGVLLDLVTTHGRGAPVELQPFSTDMLSLHSEGSGRPAAEQPRHISLLCADPGSDGTGAQTVLVSMAAVARRLDPADLALLRLVRYRRSTRGPRILREQDGRPAFSFRDFLGAPLHWSTDPLEGEGTGPGPDVDPDAVGSALRRLLAAMYAPDGAAGVHWRPGMVVVMDNTAFFHGRTLGPAEVRSPRRHLRRLRLV